MNIYILKESLKNASPVAFRKFVRTALKSLRDFRNGLQKLVSRKSIGQTDIVRSLRKTGILPGDVILVHSSLSRLGYVEGGARTVVDALLQAVGPEGTVGAPTFWGNTKIYLKGDAVYNVATSMSRLGIISELIRTTPGAFRSLHPTHSAAFVGPRAEELTDEHHIDNTPVGPHSPYTKLAQIGGKIVLLGVTLEYVPNFRTIEDLVSDFPVETYLPDPIPFTIIDKKGRQTKVSNYCHCPMVDTRRMNNRMEPYLKAKNLICSAGLGKSWVKVIDARSLHAELLRLYEKGITIFTPGGPEKND